MREIQDTVGGALESQNFMNNLYRQGLSASVTAVCRLEESKIKALQKNLQISCLVPKTPVGNTRPNRTTTYPLKMTLTDACSLN